MDSIFHHKSLGIVIVLLRIATSYQLIIVQRCCYCGQCSPGSVQYTLHQKGYTEEGSRAKIIRGSVIGPNTTSYSQLLRSKMEETWLDTSSSKKYLGVLLLISILRYLNRPVMSSVWEFLHFISQPIHVCLFLSKSS